MSIERAQNNRPTRGSKVAHGLGAALLALIFSLASAHSAYAAAAVYGYWGCTSDGLFSIKGTIEGGAANSTYGASFRIGSGDFTSLGNVATGNLGIGSSNTAYVTPPAVGTRVTIKIGTIPKSTTFDGCRGGRSGGRRF